MTLISFKRNPKGHFLFLPVFVTLCSHFVTLPANSQSINEPRLIAQQSVCPPTSGGSQFVNAETANFYIYICGGDLPNTYVGISKNQQQGGIILPLKSYDKDKFVAVNREYSYTLTRTELIVTRNGKVIAREKATWKF